MLQYGRTFETEKHQLQELNNRLAQYLSRTTQLEHENAYLITEIQKLQQAKTVEMGNQYKTEMRELRMVVGQLSFEKSQAEMEREKLWRELQAVQSLCQEETEIRRDIGGEVKSCEKELNQAHKINGALEQRLLQLDDEYKCLEEEHRHEIADLRSQVYSRRVPKVTQTYQGPPAVSMEEVQEYARSLSDGWIDTFEMYQQKVEEMEQSVKADHARLDELQREKMLRASEFDELRAEAEKQQQVQSYLEGELVQMQDRFREEFDQYQMVIEQLEHERNMLADNMAEKLRDHQHLLQVKMDLSMEVAAYRALLEGERIDMQEAQRRVNQHQRERITDIKMPSQSYTPRASTSTRQYVGVRYSEQTSNLRRAPVTASGSISPSRVIPISVTGRAQHQSPASRRDMVSFTKARAEAAATATTTTTTATTATTAVTTTDKPVVQSADQSSQEVQKKVTEEKSVEIKVVSQPAVRDEFSPTVSPTADYKSVRVVSPPMMSLVENTEVDTKRKVRDDEEEERENAYWSDTRGKGETEVMVHSPSEKKISDSVSVEEIIEKAMKPAGWDAIVSSPGDSKITYHVEKTEQEDGTTKTQIVLESKVEEELDLYEDSALDDLLSRGVKKVSLHDIEGTATGSMIQNLLSGLQGEDLGKRSVSVEIIEEPVSHESRSDEEYELEQESMPKFSQPSSTFFQIEELENVPYDSEHHKSGDDSLKTSEEAHGRNGSVQVHEVPRESESSYIHHDPYSQEYFVSTPEDEEPEEGGGITSYGHYGIVDDLSDERYYQDEGLPSEKNDEYKFMSGDLSFVKESFPECIMEEEVHVSPTVQESMLEFLKEDSLDPKDQLKGALETLQGSMSGPLKDELAFLTRVSSDNPQNMAVSVKKMQQSSDDGTTTIVAELNVSQTLDDIGLLDEEGHDLSEEQIMSALQSAHPEFLQGGAEGEYRVTISRGEDFPSGEELEDFTAGGESVTEVTEKYVKLGPSEKSFAFQMDVNNGQAEASSEPVLQSHVFDPPLKVSHDKRVAMLYLETTTDD